MTRLGARVPGNARCTTMQRMDEKNLISKAIFPFARDECYGCEKHYNQVAILQ